MRKIHLIAHTGLLGKTALTGKLPFQKKVSHTDTLFQQRHTYIHLTFFLFHTNKRYKI